MNKLECLIWKFLLKKKDKVCVSYQNYSWGSKRSKNLWLSQRCGALLTMYKVLARICDSRAEEKKNHQFTFKNPVLDATQQCAGTYKTH